jgi:hypothetical protein
MGKALLFPCVKEGESMSRLYQMFMRIARERPKKKKRLMAFQKNRVSGWKTLDDQLLLDHWYRTNGMK